MDSFACGELIEFSLEVGCPLLREKLKDSLLNECNKIYLVYNYKCLSKQERFSNIQRSACPLLDDKLFFVRQWLLGHG